MPDFAQAVFPTIEDITSLVRTLLNDTFPGLVNGVLTPGAGRVFTDDSPKMLPALNSAIRTLTRKLRNANVQFPIKEVILPNLTPVQSAGALANAQIYVGFNGYFDGETLHENPALPSDCLEVLNVWEQAQNATAGFYPLQQPGGGIINRQQSFSNQVWEWRQYQINAPGAINTVNWKIRYLAGQPPLAVPPEDFPTTSINILDCQDALAYLTAAILSRSLGAGDVQSLELQAQDAIDEMIREACRRNQTQTFRREPYGSDNGNAITSPIAGGLV
jgi:hypothetical protein